ncbi:arrestin domain-containing protein 3-like [Culicoides brevitarsis]|uniref:arrestin domain-containing protein 3-like n=1 Tax=Culicoides brevitarsis TaxID=469753 RepID=UPI00307C11A4
MVTLTVVLDKPDKRYQAGETIEAKIYISVFEPFNARSLSVRFLGVAFTEWTVSKTISQSGTTRHVQQKFVGYEEYFKDDHYFFGGDEAPIKEILPGSYDYEATFTLPKTLPTSFDHTLGHIRYEVQVTYDVPWEENYKCSEPFHVTSVLDLNMFPNLKEPIKAMEQKTFCCWCCTTDPLDIITILPKRGFVPGQNIPVTIEIDNNSNVRIDYVYLQLQERLTFQTNRPDNDVKVEQEMIKDHMFDTPVAPYQNKLFHVNLYVDPLYQWKIFPGCEIIKCDYVLKAVAGVSGCHMNPENQLSVTIGTVPFLGDERSPNDLPSYQEITAGDDPPKFEDLKNL